METSSALMENFTADANRRLVWYDPTQCGQSAIKTGFFRFILNYWYIVCLFIKSALIVDMETNRFFDKKTNIIIVASAGVGALLLVLLIAIVVKLMRNKNKSHAAESLKSKSGDNTPRPHANGYDHIEDIPGISVETDIRKTSHIDQTDNNWDPAAMNLTDSSGVFITNSLYISARL